MNALAVVLAAAVSLASVAPVVTDDVAAYRALAPPRPALRLDATLGRIAQAQAVRLANGAPFVHDGWTFRRLWAQGYRASWLGEALGWVSGEADGRAAARLVVRRWIASPEHRRLLRGWWHRLGAGVARAPDGVIYVVLLVARR
ncbi:MAG: CAP domain-containing protein [Chloroflexi bacterium]|nr:CAP domain-containing protein [Chloroflexota bacterium]